VPILGFSYSSKRRKSHFLLAKNIFGALELAEQPENRVITIIIAANEIITFFTLSPFRVSFSEALF
jgi:hypothetical protein